MAHRVVGIPLRFQNLEPRSCSHRFSAYGGDQTPQLHVLFLSVNSPTLILSKNSGVSLAKFGSKSVKNRLKLATIWLKIDQNWLKSAKGLNREVFVSQLRPGELTQRSLVAPLNRWNAILSLLQPFDRYRTPSAVGRAIGRPYLALSCTHTQIGVLNRLVLTAWLTQPRDSGVIVSKKPLGSKHETKTQ